MLLVDMLPYIYKLKFSDITVSPYRANARTVAAWTRNFSENCNTVRLLKEIEDPDIFYDAIPDLADIIKDEHKEEAFYTFKNGFYTTTVPAKCIYLLKKSYEQYKVPNLILPCICDKSLDIMFAEGYLAKDINIRDVIKTFVCPEYEPISKREPIIFHKEYAEVYNESKDTIRIVPIAIAKKLNPNTSNLMKQINTQLQRRVTNETLRRLY